MSVSIFFLFLLSATFGKTQLVIDTDMALDVDDVGAVCIAHALEQRGLVDIRGIVYNTGAKYGISAISVLNNYFERGDIPIGAYKGEFLRVERAGNFVNEIIRDFKHLVGVKSRDDSKSAVQAYREILENAENHSIAIASIGFTINLKELLESKPDEISKLSGLELIEKKIKHLSLMGGAYPNSEQSEMGSPEFNFAYDGPRSKHGKIAVAATQYVMENWPKSVPIIFNGWEIGKEIATGQKMIDNLSAKNPCARAYKYFCDAGDHQCNPKGRWSWDLVTVLHAVLLEDPEAWTKLLKSNDNVQKIAEEYEWDDYVPWKRVQGKNVVDKRGNNEFAEKENAHMSYLKVDQGNKMGRYHAFEYILDELLLEADVELEEKPLVQDQQEKKCCCKPKNKD